MPIVEPLLPRLSLPFQARNSTTDNQQDSAPSMADDGDNLNLGAARDISYHDIERRGTSLDFRVPMPTKGMGPKEIDLWNTFTNNPLPVGPNDEWIFYTGFGDDSLEAVMDFTAELESRSLGKEFWSSKTFYDEFEQCKMWSDAQDAYKEATRAWVKQSGQNWVANSIFSMKLAELAANHGQPVHVLYADGVTGNLPQHRFFSTIEAGILTAPESKIPYILRWEESTYKSAEGNVMWNSGMHQVAPIPTDIWDDPLGRYKMKQPLEPATDLTPEQSTQLDKGKGKEPAGDQSSVCTGDCSLCSGDCSVCTGDCPECGCEHSSESDSELDLELNRAKQSAAKALKNIADKDKKNAITAEDVQKFFDGVADIYLSAFNMLNVRGRLTPEAQSAVASVSNLNVLADKAWNRFKWRNAKDPLANDEVLSKGRFDEKGNIVNTRNDKLSLKDFQPSTIGPAQIAKAQLASISIASQLMDPEQLKGQSPAVRQIMNLARQTNVFNALGVFSESNLPAHLNVRYSGDPASTLAEMVKGGMTRTDWYTEGETLEQVMRHAQLAVNIGPERYDWLLSQDQILKKSGLIKQTEAIEKAVKFYNPSNMPAANLDPVMDLADAAEMTTKQVLNNKKLIIGGVVGGLTGAGAVLGTLGGLFAGGIFGRKKKRFDPKTQKLADCKGDCKPISNHEYKQKKPQLVESKITTVKSVTSIARFVTSVTSSVTPGAAQDLKPITSKSSRVRTSLTSHSTSQSTQTSVTTASPQTSSASISVSNSQGSFASFNINSTRSSGTSTHGTSSSLSASFATTSSTPTTFSTPPIMLPLFATSGTNQTRPSASSIPSLGGHGEVSTPSPKISAISVPGFVPILNPPFNGTPSNRTLTISRNETTGGSGRTPSSLPAPSATRWSRPSFSSTPLFSSNISATTGSTSAHASTLSISSGNQTFPVFGNKTSPAPLPGSINMTDIHRAGLNATTISSTSGASIAEGVPTWRPPQPERHPLNISQNRTDSFGNKTTSNPILQPSQPSTRPLDNYNRTDIDFQNKTMVTSPVDRFGTIPVWEAPHRRPDPSNGTSSNWKFTSSSNESSTGSPSSTSTMVKGTGSLNISSATDTSIKGTFPTGQVTSAGDSTLGNWTMTISRIGTSTQSSTSFQTIVKGTGNFIIPTATKSPTPTSTIVKETGSLTSPSATGTIPVKGAIPTGQIPSGGDFTSQNSTRYSRTWKQDVRLPNLAIT